MEKIKKIIYTLILFTVMFGNFQYTYAIESVEKTNILIAKQDIISDLGGNLDEYKDTGTESRSLKDKLGVVFSVVNAIGVILSVIILIILGIKYMLGSVEEKADYKKSMIPYIVGAAILFTGSFLPQLIYDIVKDIGWV